jgi:hypothetical protein
MTGTIPTEFDLITNNATAAVTIAPTIAVFVQTAGVVQLAGDQGAFVNFGSLTAGTRLDGEFHQVGTANTAVLIALR